MNSPSLMSRSRWSTAGGAPFANTRVADTYLTLAIGDLRRSWDRIRAVGGPARRAQRGWPAPGRLDTARSLDGSHRQAADQRALCYPAHNDHGNRGDGGRRAQVRDEQPLLGDGADQEHRQGGGVGDGEVDREEELVPGEDHADERGRYQPGRDQGQDHLTDLPDAAGAVQPRRLQQFG